MQEVFEKIIEKLEKELKLADEEKLRCARENPLQFDSAKGYANGVANSIEIVKQEAGQYNNGWIPCSERLPENIDFVLYANKDGEVDICSIEYFYDYMDRFTAWQQLPEPYQPNGE